jgi:acetate kinase
MTVKILVLNAGSSSQKIRLYNIADALPEQAPRPLWQADTEWIAEKGAGQSTITTVSGQSLRVEVPAASRSAVMEQMLKMLWSGATQIIDDPHDIVVVGHRVVQGGPHYQESVLITAQVKDTIRQLSAFAPLHNPINLEDIEAVEHVLPSVPQVATFDTAFHRQMPLKATIYPGPYAWYEQGIHRYGFHGISHQYCARRVAQILGRDLATLRIVNCHLGNGCSLAAIRGGRSIDTTMGFTPLEGLMMGTRSGSIDPSILLYLERQQAETADTLERILNKESGLKGISGISYDMRIVLQASEQGNERARLAIELYVYRLQTFIGSMIAALGGIDVLSFTGGVGENATAIRAATCEAFGFLNLKFDAARNEASPVDQDIATPESSVRILVVHTEEDWEIARECWRLHHKQS